ncbi:N-acyl-phosphatidylethanolamine-hydrolyzing phospholipase D [Penicillium chermesinum]|uniref:N-acyl-phosphatidylethanolamine-hydrolyzing phospholipase D n=1 Tax=Penicillium chermesinum TaxID=63820 RepID=A0A9W9NZ51_9EURO|nr:N-acyl-phosphatidylethanolamine-hydrolyzing phospholipase D [Penicillium chermesinum]KAJ5232456.1 N-acyl-phosphatidylethanolamine-hydrolyzing phospholipase D [Penicillium chermesinum]KAJ6172114.1 N-acyl-phosphatidylethanolamine-hydrolyzing phospholipase D [Penicillium chermesinum]
MGQGDRAVLYDIVVSEPAPLGRVPDNTSEKRHWVRDASGQGEIKRFVNPWESSYDFSFPEIFKSMVRHKFLSGDSQRPDTSPPTVPVTKPDLSTSRTGSQALRTTWLGHACHLVEFPSGLRVLFDPIAEIPIIDCVVISHSHYDHLSYPTVLEIHKHHPSAQFCVPKGLKKWFTESGIERVVELDWWEDVEIALTLSNKETSSETSEPGPSNPSITGIISCLPCQHTSARTPFDKSHTLWASWSVSSGGKSVYFAGDTGYRAVPLVPKGVDDWGSDFDHLPICPAFKEIGELRGPFDLGLIPIGAYKPRHVLSSVHSNPYDSVEIFKDTKCKKALAIHWGTWAVAEENVLEPPQLLRKALIRSQLPETGVFDICDIGETREF